MTQKTHPETPVAKAFITAAGHGNRLRPVTDSRPKPMVPVRGRPIIDYAIEKLAAAGVRDIWVNMHYRADVLRAHLEKVKTPALHLIDEPALLDTGGGIRQGVAAMDGAPFFIVSGDTIWTDSGTDSGRAALARLAESWDSECMDLLILLYPVARMITPGKGDYSLKGAEGKAYRAERSRDKSGDYMWTSLRLCHPRLFDGTPAGQAFSFLELMDKAEKAGRLYAIVHEGEWYHISTPADLAAIEARADLPAAASSAASPDVSGSPVSLIKEAGA